MSKEYTISNGRLTARISSLGAELRSLKDEEGLEYIWQRNPEFWGRSAPFLFPIVGSLKDGRTVIRGKTYEMKQHGVLRDQEFELLNLATDEAAFVVTYDEETLSRYPFKYKVIIAYAFRGESLGVTISVVNESDEIIPFNLGAHPAFNCPLRPGEAFTDYVVRFEHHETFNSPAVAPGGLLDFAKTAYAGTWLRSLPLSRALFAIDTVTLPRPRSRYAQLVNARTGKGVEIDFPLFTSFAIWSPYPKEAPFVCLEPWIGYADKTTTDGQFIHKDFIVLLGSLEQRDYEYTIRVLK